MSFKGGLTFEFPLVRAAFQGHIAELPLILQILERGHISDPDLLQKLQVLGIAWSLKLEADQYLSIVAHFRKVCVQQFFLE